MLPAHRHRAPSPNHWKWWPIIPVMIFFGILIPGLAAQDAQASTVDNSYNICKQLHSGESLAGIEADLVSRGMSPTDAGTATGENVRTYCPEQTAAVTAQAKAAIEAGK